MNTKENLNEKSGAFSMHGLTRGGKTPADLGAAAARKERFIAFRMV